MTNLVDTYHRNINYMRISITDRCNMRCIYCNSHLAPHLTHDDILRYKEIQKRRVGRTRKTYHFLHRSFNSKGVGSISY